MKQLCGDPVREGLNAIGRWPSHYAPLPTDFTEEERFTMFKHVLHANVWPVPDIVQSANRIAYAWSYSVSSWRNGGLCRFVQRVREAAQSELKDADYALYDLSPIRCLVGDDGRRFCRLLQASDVAEMNVRMAAMDADLDVLGRKIDAQRRSRESFGEFKYRINLYDSSYEAVIRDGKAGWLLAAASLV